MLSLRIIHKTHDIRECRYLKALQETVRGLQEYMPQKGEARA
jgi:hypothetical protein